MDPVKVRRVNMSDFLESMKRIKKSIASDNLGREPNQIQPTEAFGFNTLSRTVLSVRSAAPQTALCREAPGRDSNPRQAV